MCDDTEAYVHTYILWQHEKIEQKCLRVLLERLWEIGLMEFIVNLPKSKENKLLYLVVFKFSMYATFILAMNDLSNEKTTKLVMWNVVKY